MSITATVDGTAYTGIETITTGGKTIELTESGGGGGSVGNLSEYNIVTAKPSGNYFTVAHGLTSAPKIILFHIDKSFDQTYTGKMVGGIAMVQINGNYYGSHYYTNSSTGNVAAGIMQKVETVSEYGKFSVDDTNFVVSRTSGNAYSWDENEDYIFEFYA